jgi:CBS domain-containing protein
MARQIRASGWDRAVVVNEEHVVLGLLRGEALNGDPERTVEEVMDPGPSTFRPDVSPEELAAYMQQGGIDSVLITAADGKLVGILEHTAAE